MNETKIGTTASHRIGIHVLTAYPPSNPNRDETGQPKTAIVGGVTRQRISSQCIKRTWRLSTPIRQVDARFSTRSRDLGVEVEKRLLTHGVDSKSAREWASLIAGAFGKVEKKSAPSHSEMVVIGHEEWDATMALADRIAASKDKPADADINALPRPTVSLDCALFGRMRAAQPGLNVEAAVSVSHPLTVERASVDSDFWTSVDDLKQARDDSDQGSGGMGEVEYGSGTYYTYIEVDLEQLRSNLKSNTELAADAVQALTRAIATECPGGHRTTFGNRVRATYVRVEAQEPSGNLFCAAFEKPVAGTQEAIEALRGAAERESRAYGLAQEAIEMSVPEGRGSLNEVLAFVRQACAAR